MGLPPLDDVETFACWAVAAIVSPGKLAAIQAPPIRNLRQDILTSVIGFCSRLSMVIPPFGFD
jgi:hypothetical protein